MEAKLKLALLGAFMLFSLFYALSPTNGGVRTFDFDRSSVASNSESDVEDNLNLKLRKDNDKVWSGSSLGKTEFSYVRSTGSEVENADNTDLDVDTESDEDEKFEENYPKYDATKYDEVQDKVTPEELALLKSNMVSDSELAANNEEEENEENEHNKGSIFVDHFQFENAPRILVLAESKRIKYRPIVLQHERYYRTHVARLYVPRLKKNTKLSIEDFAKRFLYKSQPVIIPFEAMRHLNFTTKAYTFEQLLKLYPNRGNKVYKYGAGANNVEEDGEIDLGPALATLSQDTDLKKTKEGRNYPRNMKVNLDSIKQLGVQYPPFVIKGTKMMAPSVWFGATTSSTPTHSDCCDNFAMMIAGTKRWSIAPPSEARLIKPKCNGGLCWGNKLEHSDEHAYTEKMKKLRDQTQLIDFDLNAGEVLYLPCGWFHHVENKGPTVMVNFWTKDKPFFLQYLDGEAVIQLQ